MIPPMMGYAADVTGAIQAAMGLPLVCFVVVVLFGVWGHRAGQGAP